MDDFLPRMPCVNQHVFPIQDKMSGTRHFAGGIHGRKPDKGFEAIGNEQVQVHGGQPVVSSDAVEQGFALFTCGR
jgi:hypothetical protein